jgi:F-type H+-transporting ATPase subunit b
MEILAKLGIEPWSMLLYFVNTGILVLVLAKLLYKPILKYVDERRAVIEGSITEAEQLKKTFEEKLAEILAEKEALHASLKEQMEKTAKTLQEKEAQLVADMTLAKTRMLEEAHVQIEKEKAELMKDAEARTMSLIQKVVLYIVQNKVPAEVVRESVQDAWKMYRS